MNPEDDPSLDALSMLGRTMGRGRFMDALPAEEQEAIRIVISPGGGVTISGGGGDVDMDGQTAENEEAAQQRATGGGRMFEGDEMPPEGTKLDAETFGKFDEDPDALTEMSTRRR